MNIYKIRCYNTPCIVYCVGTGKMLFLCLALGNKIYPDQTVPAIYVWSGYMQNTNEFVTRVEAVNLFSPGDDLNRLLQIKY